MVHSESRALGFPQTYTAYKLTEEEATAVVAAKKNDKIKKQKKEKDKDKGKEVEETAFEINPYLRLYNELTVPLLFQAPQKNYEA